MISAYNLLQHEQYLPGHDNVTGKTDLNVRR